MVNNLFLQKTSAISTWRALKTQNFIKKKHQTNIFYVTAEGLTSADGGGGRSAICVVTSVCNINVTSGLTN